MLVLYLTAVTTSSIYFVHYQKIMSVIGSLTNQAAFFSQCEHTNLLWSEEIISVYKYIMGYFF